MLLVPIVRMPHGVCMKISSFVLMLVLMVANSATCCVGESVPNAIVRAAALNEAGKFRAALELVEPLLHPEDSKPNAPIGIAWNIRGLALQSLGDRDQARRSYETAIHLLRKEANQQAQYASALDNLGSLEAEAGRSEESKTLRVRAEHVYALAGDRAGVARTLVSLAIVAMGQGNRREARRHLADAFHEESLLAKPDFGDLAAMCSAQALEEERDGNYQAALIAIERAIDLWTEHYGPHYYLLADGYSLRGRARGGLHDYPDAIEDLQRALKLLDENGQSESRVYFFTEVSYAQVLRGAGMKDEASRAESEARAALDGLRDRQCGGCTVSAESLR
jgi:tetratricopeptide (TPR) repeat protein